MPNRFTPVAALITSLWMPWLIGAQAFAAGAPSALTLPASAVTPTNAQINGTFGANGADTGVFFDFGLSTNYSQRLFLTGIDAATASTTLGATITSTLTSGQTYHYRAVSSNSFGIALGDDTSFTTLAGPPLAVTDAPRDITATSAELRGQASLRGSTGAAFFEFGTTTSYGQVLGLTNLPNPTSTFPVAATVSGLTQGVPYHYRMVCSNAVSMVFGADESFMTGTAAPPVAVTLAADVITSGGARLNGLVNPNGSTTEVLFELGTTTSYGTTLALGSIGNGLSAIPLNVSVSGLQSSMTYHFRIVGRSAAGTNQGADLTFTTSGGPGGTAPTVTTGAAENITNTAARVNGTVNPNGAATTAWFELGTTTNYGIKSFTANLGTFSFPVSFSADFGGLSPATTYHYRVVAQNPSGTNYGLDAMFTTLGGLAIAPTAVDTNTLAPGHRVRLRQATPAFGNVTNVEAAESLLSLAPGASGIGFDAYDVGVAVINYADFASSPPPQGRFGLDRDIHVIPGNTGPAGDQDNYAMEMTGYVYIPTPGAWTFTVNSDEGFRLRMGAANAVVMEFPGPSTGGDSVVVVNAPAAGYYHYQLVYFEWTGGSQIDFFARGPGQALQMLVGDPFSLLPAWHDIDFPRLDIARQAGQVVLSWPLPSGPWTLQSNTNLASGATWGPAGPAPVVTAGQYVVTNDVSAPALFYRLKLP